MRKVIPLLALLLCLPVVSGLAQKGQTRPEPTPTVGKPAPTFTLPDADGSKRSLASLKGTPVVLLFFCGCSWCYEVAQEWATLQKADALRPAPTPGKEPAPVPWTVLIYQGSVEEVKSLATRVGLGKSRTLLLPDPESRVTGQIYRADPCPRVFVLDARGIVRYINTGPDDRPREAPAAAIVARTLSALREAASVASATSGEKKP